MLGVIWAGITGNPITRAIFGALGLALAVLVAFRLGDWNGAMRGRRSEREKAHVKDLERARDLRRRGDVAFRRVLRPDEIVYRD